MLCLRTLTHYPLLSTGSIQERKFYEHKRVAIRHQVLKPENMKAVLDQISWALMQIRNHSFHPHHISVFKMKSHLIGSTVA